MFDANARADGGTELYDAVAEFVAEVGASRVLMIGDVGRRTEVCAGHPRSAREPEWSAPEIASGERRGAMVAGSPRDVRLKSPESAAKG